MRELSKNKIFCINLSFPNPNEKSFTNINFKSNNINQLFYICPVLATNNLGLSSSYFLDDVGIYKITNNTLLNSINQLRSQMSNRWDDQLLRKVILKAQRVYCNQSKIFHDIEMINVNKLNYLDMEHWLFQISSDVDPYHQLLLQTAELDSDSENKPLSVNIDKTFEDKLLIYTDSSALSAGFVLVQVDENLHFHPIMAESSFCEIRKAYLNSVQRGIKLTFGITKM